MRNRRSRHHIERHRRKYQGQHFQSGASFPGGGASYEVVEPRGGPKTNSLQREILLASYVPVETRGHRHTQANPHMKVVTRAIRTRYWKPGDDYQKIILDSISAELNEGDVVAVSEKALAVAQGRIIDESTARPGLVARGLAGFWMRLVWGFVLSRLCHLKPVNIKRLRTYPLREGARHKQVCLDYVGFLQALRPFSEGGIDTTNLPYSLASLPLESPKHVAEEIREMIADRLGKNITLTIVDSDKTYSYGAIHLSSRQTEIPGLINLGLLAYLIGRAFKWRARSTPIAWVGSEVSPDHALRLAGLANKARGYGAGRTAWDMAVRFGVGLTEVDWEMLEQVEHRPIVILRFEARKP